MPQFFFHLRRDGVLERDPDGVSCVGVDAARTEALRTAREMISRDALTGSGNVGYVFEIENEAGEVVARLPFSHAIGA